MIKKENNNEAIAIINSGSLKMTDVPVLLEKVNAQIKALKGGADDTTQTSGELEGFGNIHKLDDTSKLIQAYASINIRKKIYDEAAADMKLGTKYPKFTIEGASAEKWLSDIEKRYAVVTHKDKIDKLTKVKEELEKNLSQEAKLVAAMANITDLLID